MFEYVRKMLDFVEADPQVITRDAVFDRLRQLGLDDFGEVLMLSPVEGYPKLSALLPTMASAEVQNAWTGGDGYVLLKQTCSFVRSLSYNFAAASGKSLRSARILDYGCGYGRIARLMYYFTDSDRLFGVDPWDRSIALCDSAGLGPNFRQSEYLPSELPVEKDAFDIAYAFSVFTHLSSRATLAALGAIRKHVKPSGLLALTIRPIDYWNFSPAEVRAELRRQHEKDGFAFAPHPREPVEGEVTYGETSISLEWLDRNVSSWRRIGIDRSLDDPYQLYVYMMAT